MAVGPVETARPPATRRSFGRWVTSFLLFLVCLEIGLFLLVFPWAGAWSSNGVPDYLPISAQVWDSGYLRGAVSGLGLANIWIAFGILFGRRK